MTAPNFSSFLPYLDEANGRFFLRILPASQDNAILQKVACPFLIISDSNPFGRLIAAQLVTDAGEKVRSIFLLVQKDRYIVPKDSLRPITNTDVDKIWQDTFAFYSRQQENGNLIILKGQFGNDGKLIPFQPMFYCKHRYVFFHPPCPSCGAPLIQCLDDSILSNVNLSLYSNSVRRYLFCESCWLLNGNSRFFVYDHDISDSTSVTDFAGLIKEFGSLAQERLDLTEFPCTGCSYKGDCYGSEHLVITRLVPFSFHSFHMLVFEAMSLNAADFLALLGGASFSALEEQLNKTGERGRLGCLAAINRHESTLPFVFEEHDNYFLEVFYLKLSFLAELAQIVLSKSVEFGPDTVGLLMDAIWVRVHDEGMRLPYTWNFKVDIIDTVRLPDDTSGRPPELPTRNRYFLGLVWLYALLVNSRQDIAAMYQSVRKVMQHPDLFSDWLRGEPESQPLARALAPENLFWNPLERPVPDEWLPWWKRALGLGFSFLGDRFLPDRRWSREQWQREIQALQAEVKDLMLRGPAVRAQPVEAAATKVEKEAIAHILERIREKWAKVAKVEPAPSGARAGAMVPSTGEPAQGVEAVAVSDSPRSDSVADAPENVPFIEDAITETIIISPQRPPGEPVGPTADSSTPAEDLKGEAGMPGLGRVGTDSDAPDALAETIFLGGQPREADRSDESEGPLSTQPEDLSHAAASEEDLLPATVMLAPGQAPQVKANKQESALELPAAPLDKGQKPEEDELLATVQITPGQRKP
ncbi:MAG TPA: hypothetical protein DCE18_00135 [Syntrophobacteraceae bacterium]|nr:hypothetical protein [Syntrophobacteraceae bacterium]